MLRHVLSRSGYYVERQASACLIDFTRVGRPQGDPRDAAELARRLEDHELEEIEATGPVDRLWKTFSDEDFGGKSSCTFRLSPEEGGKAVFAGKLSDVSPRGSPFNRYGYCAARCELPPSHCQVDDFDGFEVIFKSDGKKYIFNMGPDSCIPLDLYQGFLVAPPDAVGKWCSAVLPFNKLQLTGLGSPREEQREFDQGAMKSVGFSLQGDGQEGDFCLEIKQINVVDVVMHNKVDLQAVDLSKGTSPGAW